MPNIEIHGIACHIGSQITKTTPFTDALAIVINMVKRLAGEGIDIKQLDLGGGLGIDYQGETPPSAAEYVQGMLDGIKAHGIDLPIAIEPGRYIAGNSGVLLTEVEYLKHNETKNFAIKKQQQKKMYLILLVQFVNRQTYWAMTGKLQYKPVIYLLFARQAHMVL